MTAIKTKKTGDSVETYINGLADDQQRKDSLELVKIMKKVTKAEPKLWSNGAIGFGEFSYTQKGKKTVNKWYPAGFAPRKGNISVMFMGGFQDKKLLEKLGKYKTGGGCLYINSLADIDKKVLEEMIRGSLSRLEEFKKERGWV